MTRASQRRWSSGLGRLALVFAIVGGIAAGTYALFVMLRPDKAAREPGTILERLRPNRGIAEGETCGRTEVTAELDGDGLIDRVVVWGQLHGGDASCTDPQAEVSWRVAVALGTGQRFEGKAPACRWPDRCVLVAAPDLDGDGRAEIALSPWTGASTVGVRLYRVRLSETEGPLEAIEIAPPGDPAWGHRPGPAEFTLYGSVTHLGALRCVATPPGSRRLTAVGMALKADRYRMHETTFSLGGTTLVVTDVRDYVFTSADVPYVALPPARRRDGDEAAPLIVAWHLNDPPRSAAAMDFALPLAGVVAWRVWPICHRLPLIALARVHKRSIPCPRRVVASPRARIVRR